MSTEEQENKFDPGKICGLCNNATSKYCCPRCDTLYCSLDCYKSSTHSECSENFYRECINEELASLHTDDESKQKMIDILKKMRNEDLDDNIEEIDNEVDSDDGNEIDLHERLQGLNLEDADAVWNALTEDERNEFQAILSHGDVGSIIEHWEPWWMYRRDKKLVEEANGNDVDREAMKLCPKIKKVPELSLLMKSQPSPMIKFNIINVLTSYSFLMRYFNGEIEPKEGTLYLLDICNNLDLNTNFDSVPIAIESVAQKCLQSKFIETDTTSINVMKYDTFLILQGPSEDNPNYYSIAALTHIHDMFTQAKAQFKMSHIHDMLTQTKTKSDENSGKRNEKVGKSDEKVEISDKKDEKSDTKVEKSGEFTKNFPEHKMENLMELDLSKVKKCIKKVELYISYVNAVGMDLD